MHTGSLKFQNLIIFSQIEVYLYTHIKLCHFVLIECIIYVIIAVHDHITSKFISHKRNVRIF